MTVPLLPGLAPAGEAGAERERLARRWMELTCTVLPGMAAAQGWPIRWDHCFMRVCLDNALGRPWHEVVRRPAIRWLELHQLRAAVEVAEGIAADPRTLPELNDASLAWRRAARHG
ncbi:MAG TPA: hypothetical protein VGC15_16120 [Acetobacteraceae bacterium]